MSFYIAVKLSCRVWDFVCLPKSISSKVRDTFDKIKGKLNCKPFGETPLLFVGEHVRGQIPERELEGAGRRIFEETGGRVILSWVCVDKNIKDNRELSVKLREAELSAKWTARVRCARLKDILPRNMPFASAAVLGYLSSLGDFPRTLEAMRSAVARLKGVFPLWDEKQIWLFGNFMSVSGALPVLERELAKSGVKTEGGTISWLPYGAVSDAARYLGALPFTISAGEYNLYVVRDLAQNVARAGAWRRREKMLTYLMGKGSRAKFETVLGSLPEQVARKIKENVTKNRGEVVLALKTVKAFLAGRRER